MSTANIFGGTPKKTLDLIKYTDNESYIYFWSNQYEENTNLFTDAGATVCCGDYGRNLFQHLRVLLKIIDNYNIQLIQTQFSFGEIIANIVKLFRPKVKVVIAFVGPFSPCGFKKNILKYLYKNTDQFVYVSKYVKTEKTSVFTILKNKPNNIIYNGTELRCSSGDHTNSLKNFSLLDVAGLVDWKNISILLEAMTIIIKEYKQDDIYLYVAGDGPARNSLAKKIKDNNLDKNIFLLGYQFNIGFLIDQCDIFVHPAHAEGFGIAVAEAMIAEKPIIVSNAGALPELIEHEKSGLVVDPLDSNEWANAILRLKANNIFAGELARNAKIRADREFSIKKYVNNYQRLYKTLLA